jgi:flagellar motor protein MotB
MISFADMMSLLMAFFVMLSTFSNFGPEETNKLQETVDAMLAPVSYGVLAERPITQARNQILAAGQSGLGSEKPTLDQPQGNGLLPAYKVRRVFLADSRKVFWGSGVVLSDYGQSLFDTVAAFVNRVPGRIIISENGPDGDRELSLLRAISVVDYLVASGIARTRCNISVRSMRPEEEFANNQMLEIVLLDESLYK